MRLLRQATSRRFTPRRGTRSVHLRRLHPTRPGRHRRPPTRLSSGRAPETSARPCHHRPTRYRHIRSPEQTQRHPPVPKCRLGSVPRPPVGGDTRRSSSATSAGAPTLDHTHIAGMRTLGACAPGNQSNGALNLRCRRSGSCQPRIAGFFQVFVWTVGLLIHAWSGGAVAVGGRCRNRAGCSANA